MTTYAIEDLPGLDCGTCGFRSCEDLADRLTNQPELIKRCIYLSEDRVQVQEQSQNGARSLFAVPDLSVDSQRSTRTPQPSWTASPVQSSCAGCGVVNTPVSSVTRNVSRPVGGMTVPYLDSLGRDFDFYLEHFPEEPGPREIIIPHNPLLTREMDIQVGDVLIGRPLGMSCGCPITHCGIAMDVDKRTGVIVWCVTGPLNPRLKGFKDLGYYIAEGYEGLIHEARCEIRIGERYYFQPKMCMLQWRHSGLVNYLNRLPNGYQVRVEGLWIG